MAYTKQQLFNEIARHFQQRVDKPSEGYWWKFQNYFHFINDNTITQDTFYVLMQELCNDGIFTVVYEEKGAPPTFELTAKGERLIWNN